jgi:hypothetical protein
MCIATALFFALLALEKIPIKLTGISVAQAFRLLFFKCGRDACAIL